MKRLLLVVGVMVAADGMPDILRGARFAEKEAAQGTPREPRR